jgi:hypothetical protein
MILPITEETFPLYAAKYYENPACHSMKDFYDDLDIFVYLKRLLLKQHRKGMSNHRLIINHLITLHNIFGHHAIPMLFYKIPSECWPILKTFLVFLNYLPDNYKINGHIDESTIPLESNMINTLREI